VIQYLCLMLFFHIGFKPLDEHILKVNGHTFGLFSVILEKITFWEPTREEMESEKAQASSGFSITLDLPVMNWQTHSPPEQHFPSSCSQLASSVICKDMTHPLRYLETSLSHNQLSFSGFRFPQRNWPFLVSPSVNCPVFAATVTAFFFPLTYAG